MSTSLKTYRVFVEEWRTYMTYIDAPSKKAAVEAGKAFFEADANEFSDLETGIKRTYAERIVPCRR